jgi:hypothetical protein
MFQDFKSGGYDLEGTGLKGKRLILLILLIAIAYSSAVIQGTSLKKEPAKEYIVRPKESKRKYPHRSTFGRGLDSQQGVTYLDKYVPEVQELRALTPQKRCFYQRGMRATTHIRSTS